MSVYKQFFNQGNDYTYSIDGIIYYWQGYLTLMQHWNNLYGKEILHVSYDGLTRRPDKRIKKILSYCSLKEEPDCFRFYESDRPVLTPSSSQVRQPIHRKSVGSGKHYQPFIQNHISQLAQIRGKIREVLNI